MNQTEKILYTLKKQLRAKGVTYLQVAEILGLSETSVKRMFSEKSFSMKRLEEVCRILDMDIFEIVKLTRENDDSRFKELTLEQENRLVKDPRMLAYLYLLISGWSAPAIVAEFEISELESTRMLLELEQLGLIESISENKLRVKVSKKSVFWRKDGPIWNIYKKKVQDEFFDYPFEGSNDRLFFNTGIFTESSLKTIASQIEKLIKQFDEMADIDSSTPSKNRKSVGIFVGARPYTLPEATELKRRLK